VRRKVLVQRNSTVLCNYAVEAGVRLVAAAKEDPKLMMYSTLYARQGSAAAIQSTDNIITI
jgi:hypothetical protein